MQEPVHRIGTIARLAGVPVPTLRVWETRHQAFAPRKTAGQQRLYDEQDLLRATLLRQLSEAGHAIGQIARLDADALNRLWQQHQGLQQREARRQAPVTPITLAVVGLGLAARVGGAGFQSGLPGGTVQVAAAFADLQAALGATLESPPQILLLRAGSLHEIVWQGIRQVVQRHGIRQVIVVYGYGREPLLQAMRQAGILLRREPVSDTELADLVRSVLMVDAAAGTAPAAAGAMIPARRYSEETLARVAAISSQVLCECPRHVADLIAQLASFEQYSQECLNRSAEDAHLHAHLASISGTARALFEAALEKIALHEGIALG